MKSFLCSVLFLSSLLFPLHVFAITDPLSTPNNIFGIHIIDPNDLDLAASLVNSNSGDWGYVTLVIREDDRNLEKWQSAFDRMRELHLIPIVRLATKSNNHTWDQPRVEDIEPWVDFLSSLNWVVENRYIILFNEPNHASEWGGHIDPIEYAQIITNYVEALRRVSSDFFILPAALDLSASSTTTTMSPQDFYQAIYNKNPQYFSLFDGWANHSYPNPNFSSSPFSTGQQSIKGYLWEQQLIHAYGVNSNLPIFITETGWAHNCFSSDFSLSPQKVSQYFTQAFSSVWTESNIIAITPFILNYNDTPFSQFSWIDYQTAKPLAHFDSVKKISKITGVPSQNRDSHLHNRYFPKVLISKSTIKIAVTYINSGQTIWDNPDYQLHVNSSMNSDAVIISSLPKTKPFDLAKVWLDIDVPDLAGVHQLTLQLYYLDHPFGESVTYNFKIGPSTSLGDQIRFFLEKLFHYQELIVFGLYQLSYARSTI